MDDFELQLQNLENMALHFSIDNKYQYSSLIEKKYNEKILLEDFKKYLYSSPLTKDIFLYYGDTRVFHISGHTIDLDIYARTFTETQKETLKDALLHPGYEMQLLSINNNLYCLIPFKNGFGDKSYITVMGAVLSFETLKERFEIIGGDTQGTVFLYNEETLLYNSQPGAFDSTEISDLGNLPSDLSNNLLFASSSSQRYTIAFLPYKEPFSVNQLLHFALILLNILLLMIISSVFAKKAFQPIQDIHDKYKDTPILQSNDQHDNVFDNLDRLINDALQYSEKSVRAGRQKQQILLYLLNGIDSHSLDIQSYLQKSNIMLPGPFYYVICISYANANVEDDFLNLMQKELEHLTLSDNGEYIHIVCNYATKQLNVICSIQNRQTKEELSEYVKAVAESYSYKPIIGTGHLYEGLAKISASWLESIDRLTKTQYPERQNNHPPILNVNDLLWLKDALSNASEQEALAGLKKYFQEKNIDKMSTLMQRYLFAEFIGEISRLSKIAGIELSTQNISLLISAKNAASFFDAAQELFLEYCQKVRILEQSRKTELAHQICHYIEEHFMEYDISLEKVAASFDISTTIVRESTLKITGKMYKDYIIYLRTEYAKKLLTNKNLSVIEVSQMVGYNSVSYFIRMFKDMTGITPAKYAKKNV